MGPFERAELFGRYTALVNFQDDEVQSMLVRDHITMIFDWTSLSDFVSLLQTFLHVQFLIQVDHSCGYHCSEWCSRGKLAISD